MYKSVITFKEGLSAEVLRALRETAIKAFDNRLGKAENVGEDLYKCVFEGDEELRPCLQVGTLTLGDENGFIDCVKTWEWVDIKYPRENHSVLTAFDKIAMMRAR